MSPTLNWLQEGRDVGVTLDKCHAVVVVGSDPTATAEVALGIARVQAQHRRVAVGDMFGDAPPLTALVDSDDPHGLMDSFLYGVSLNRVAHLVPDAGQLFIMPSGTGPLDYEELFQHPRWRRLATGFREVGALLLICAPAEAAHVRQLVESTDGAVLVGETVPMNLPVALSLAWVRPRRSPTIPAAGQAPPAQGVPTGVTPTPPAGASWPLLTGWTARRLLAPVAGVALTLVLAGAGFWFAGRPWASRSRANPGITATSPAVSRVTAGTLAPDSVATARRDSQVQDSIARANRAAGAALGGTTLTGISPAPASGAPAPDPGTAADSARAAAWAIRLETVFTPAGAMLDLEKRYKAVPAGTFNRAPGTRFLFVTAGAFPTQAGADSLLELLRARGVVSPKGGIVISAPFAFLVEAGVPAAEVAARLKRFAGPGTPVYALRQADGTANLYYGAFESSQQAEPTTADVRAAGITPRLVYRIGRVF